MSSDETTQDAPGAEQPPPDAAAETARFEGTPPSSADFSDQTAADDTADETIQDSPPTPDAPVLEFSAAAKERVAWLRTRYPEDHQRALILPLLSMAQREFGWVSPQVIRYVAAQIPVPPMWVEEVATFYTMYNTAPTGRWHLQVCHNISCALMGAEIVIEHLSERLGIHLGETTADGEFTLVGAECLGSCGTAPMMQVNDHYHENLSLQDVDDLLERLRATPDVPCTAADLPHGPGSGPSRALPRDGAPLLAGAGVVVPHPGAAAHRADPKAREAVDQRPHAQDPDDKRGYTPQGMASP